MWHVAFFPGSDCSQSREQLPAPAPRQIHPGKGSPALPWGLAGHSQGRFTPGRFIRQVYNPLPVLQPPPSPVTTWTAGFQQHRRSTGLFQSRRLPAPCPSAGSASASRLRRCRNQPGCSGTVLLTAGQQLPGSAPSPAAASGTSPAPGDGLGVEREADAWWESFLLLFVLGVAGAALLSSGLSGCSPV